jgi:Methyltransferase domain
MAVIASKRSFLLGSVGNVRQEGSVRLCGLSGDRQAPALWRKQRAWTILYALNMPQRLVNALRRGVHAMRTLLNVPELVRENARLTAELTEYQRGWPPGHYYSPVPSIEELRRREDIIFGTPPRVIPGIDLNEEGQLALLEQLARYYDEQPFTPQKVGGRRYFFENPNYSYGEALVLYAMVRHLRPANIVEVGSGYSSCAILDTSELFFDGSINCTFVDPYPELLLSLLEDTSPTSVRVVHGSLQDVGDDLFAQLRQNDILFIDSTHVAKVGSDVNRIFADLLPAVSPGVYIHFHDIYYPFEYPKKWLYEGRAWNEAYVLRSFLQFNRGFEIVYFNSFLAEFHEARLRKLMPLCMKAPGSSIWVKRVA